MRCTQSTAIAKESANLQAPGPRLWGPYPKTDSHLAMVTLMVKLLDSWMLRILSGCCNHRTPLQQLRCSVGVSESLTDMRDDSPPQSVSLASRIEAFGASGWRLLAISPRVEVNRIGGSESSASSGDIGWLNCGCAASEGASRVLWFLRVWSCGGWVRFLV
jgi:hypothetical protein